jgi:predicted DNA-binding antitoxin AbrB/MazE fold protein
MPLGYQSAAPALARYCIDLQRVYPAKSQRTILDAGRAMELMNAVFENGSFRPESAVDLPEGTRVRISVETIQSGPQPRMLSIEERRRIRQRVVERMMKNPLPPNAQRFSRNNIDDRD